MEAGRMPSGLGGLPDDPARRGLGFGVAEDGFVDQAVHFSGEPLLDRGRRSGLPSGGDARQGSEQSVEFVSGHGHFAPF